MQPLTMLNWVIDLFMSTNMSGLPVAMGVIFKNKECRFVDVAIMTVSDKAVYEFALSCDIVN